MKFSALPHLLATPLITPVSIGKKVHFLRKYIPTWIPYLLQSLHALLTPEAAHEELSEGIKFQYLEMTDAV